LFISSLSVQLKLLQVSRPVIRARLAAQHPLKGRPELGAEDSVDDRVQGRVEVAEPQKEGDEGVVELVVFEDGHHDRQDEEGKPAGDEGPGHDGQGLGGFPLPLGFQGNVFLFALLFFVESVQF